MRYPDVIEDRRRISLMGILLVLEVDAGIYLCMSGCLVVMQHAKGHWIRG